MAFPFQAKTNKNARLFIAGEPTITVAEGTVITVEIERGMIGEVAVTLSGQTKRGTMDKANYDALNALPPEPPRARGVAPVAAGSVSGMQAQDKRSLARSVLVEAIRPALTTLAAGGLAPEQLLLGTGIQESLLIHRQQLGGGPALGLFQMESATHDDCWNNFLKFRKGLADKVTRTLNPEQKARAAAMKVNDRYAAAMCRVRYMRVAAALPAANDIEGMANYWKEHYNTPLGAGTPEEFLNKWPQYVDAHTFD
jgi:hypothetical protein